MKFDGGYNVMLEGAPESGIATYQKPEVLYLPLISSRLEFSLLQVEHGEEVSKGQVLATDPVNFSVPLLAPMDGTVNLELAENHITLENLSSADDAAPEQVEEEDPRQTLVRLGVWSSISRIDTSKIPDPENAPEWLIIPVSRLEPFFPTPTTLLSDSVDKFAAGLDALHKMLEDASICLILSEADSEAKSQLQALVAQRSD